MECLLNPSTSEDQSKNKYQKKLMRSLTQFIETLQSYPGWKERQSQKIDYTLYFDEPIMQNKTKARTSHFKFPHAIEIQHAVAMNYFVLVDSVLALKECEYYFRRFPFNGLPIGRHRHIVLTCEMYFSRFYEIRSRFKNLLNSANKLVNDTHIDVAGFLKLYDKIFNQELRARNAIHHHERFDDLKTNRMFLQDMLLENANSSDISSALIRRIKISRYRRLSREWVQRVRDRGLLMENLLELIAKEIVEKCTIINEPSQFTDLTSSDV